MTDAATRAVIEASLERVNESWAATTTLEEVLASLELWWSARSGGGSQT